MQKQTALTIKMESDLRAEFTATALAAHTTVSQAIRELMREYIKRQQHELAYHKFLKKKVALARASIKEHGGIPHKQVVAEFAERRAKRLNRTC